MAGVYTKGKTCIKKSLYKLRWYTGTPIFVYQMGKVASSSIYRSLFEQYWRGNVIHGHELRPNHYYWTVQELYKHYDEDKPIKIISPIREPISRNISAFFHNTYHNPDNKKVDFNLSDSSIEELKQIFLEYYDHDWPLKWFDKNIKKHFKIDVFDYDFPTCGYKIINKNNTDILIFKHDIIDQQKEELIKDFTGLSSFRLKNINQGTDKPYSRKYKNFKSKVTFSDIYINKMLNSQYVQHFYTSEEIQTYRKEWSTA